MIRLDVTFPSNDAAADEDEFFPPPEELDVMMVEPDELRVGRLWRGVANIVSNSSLAPGSFM